MSEAGANRSMLGTGPSPQLMLDLWFLSLCLGLRGRAEAFDDDESRFDAEGGDSPRFQSWAECSGLDPVQTRHDMLFSFGREVPAGLLGCQARPVEQVDPLELAQAIGTFLGRDPPSNPIERGGLPALWNGLLRLLVRRTKDGEPGVEDAFLKGVGLVTSDTLRVDTCRKHFQRSMAAGRAELELRADARKITPTQLALTGALDPACRAALVEDIRASQGPMKSSAFNRSYLKALGENAPKSRSIRSRIARYAKNIQNLFSVKGLEGEVWFVPSDVVELLHEFVSWAVEEEEVEEEEVEEEEVEEAVEEEVEHQKVESEEATGENGKSEAPALSGPPPDIVDPVEGLDPAEPQEEPRAEALGDQESAARPAAASAGYAPEVPPWRGLLADILRAVRGAADHYPSPIGGLLPFGLSARP